MIRLLFLLLPISLSSQTYLGRMTHSGGPNQDTILTFISRPYQKYRIDLNTLSVIDAVSVDIGDTILRVAVGTECSAGMRGQRGYLYVSEDTSYTQDCPPADFYVPYNLGCQGTARIEFTTKCDFTIKAEGNDICNTVYTFDLWRMKDTMAQVIVYDTIQACTSYTRHIYDCDTIKRIVYVDNTPDTSYSIKYYDCSVRNTADLVWDSHVSVTPSPYDLERGIHYFEFYNNVCSIDLAIDIDPPVCKVFIPSAFSPNNDGINDTFMPYYQSDYPYKLYIFDRWGNQLHEGQEWDGTYRGKQMDPGVYVYMVRIKDELFKGDITLFR